jgi:hypothetical protein
LGYALLLAVLLFEQFYCHWVLGARIQRFVNAPKRAFPQFLHKLVVERQHSQFLNKDIGIERILISG